MYYKCISFISKVHKIWLGKQDIHTLINNYLQLQTNKIVARFPNNITDSNNIYHRKVYPHEAFILDYIM